MANTIILPFSELQAELNDEAMIDPNAVIDITENGLYNVAKYGYANVNVEGGGGETWETVFEGSVTTEGESDAWGLIPNISAITADSIRVTFNGVEYTCEKVNGGYGAPWDDDAQAFDFSTYPFFITETEIHTETAGTYTLKIEEPQSGGSSDFSTAEVKAVQNVLGVNFKTIAYIDGGEMLAGYDEADEFFMRSFNWVSVNDPLNVVMYNGHANLILARNGEMQIVATENPDNVVITYDDEMGMYNLALTGDCTITIS